MTFRFSVVGLGFCPFPAPDGQPDALLAAGRGNECDFQPYQRLPCVKDAERANSVTEGWSLQNLLSYDSMLANRLTNKNFMEDVLVWVVIL